MAASRRKAAFAAAIAVCLAGWGGLALFPRGQGQDGDAQAGEIGHALMAAGDYRRAAETLRAAYKAAPSETLKIALSRALLASGDYEGVLDILTPDETRASANTNTGAGAGAGAGAGDYLRAEALLGSERYGEARDIAASLAAARHGDGRAMLLAARAHYGAGDRDAAAAQLAKALRAGGDGLGEAWLLRARLALDANQLDAAHAAIARARESGAVQRLTVYLQAEALMRAGDFAGARAGLAALAPAKRRRVRHIDPQHDYVAARIDAASGDYQSATRRLRAVQHLLAGEAGARLLAGLVLERAGDVAQAEAALRRSLMIAPNDALRLDALTAFFIRQGRWDAAESVAARLSAAQPEMGTGALRRMQILLLRGDHDGALAQAKKAAPARLARLASVAAFGPMSAMAQQDAAALRAPIALIAGAEALRAADDGAIRRAAGDLENFGDEPAALALAGELFLALDDDARAGALFERALGAAPAFEAALIGRLRIDVRAGDFEGAEARLSSVIALDTDNIIVRVALARVLRARGRPAEAVALLRPIAPDIAALRNEAAFYARLLQSLGAKDELDGFADQARRALPADPLTAALLAEAGRLEEASRVARDAALAAPADETRARAYAALMTRRGRAVEAAAFLRALAATTDRDGATNFSPKAPASAPAVALTLKEARAAYLAAPTDWRAASRFGNILAATGAEAASARLIREACFWAPEENCPPPSDSAS